MNPKVRIFIQYLEPVDGVQIPPEVHEFHTWEMRQERPVHTIYGQNGDVKRLEPDPTVTTTIKATHTKSPVG